MRYTLGWLIRQMDWKQWKHNFIAIVKTIRHQVWYQLSILGRFVMRNIWSPTIGRYLQIIFETDVDLVSKYCDHGDGGDNGAQWAGWQVLMWSALVRGRPPVWRRSRLTDLGPGEVRAHWTNGALLYWGQYPDISHTRAVTTTQPSHKTIGWGSDAQPEFKFQSNPSRGLNPCWVEKVKVSTESLSCH